MQRAATRSLAPPSSNLSRTGEVGWLTGILARALFRPVKVDPEAARHVSERARDQAVVYVVRYRSWFDYLLVRTTLARAGMPRPVFAPDLPGAWLTSWRDSLRHVRSWLRSSRVFARARDRGAQRQESRRLVEARKPILIFMRLRAPGVGGVARAPEALERARTGALYLRATACGQWSVAADVCFVPLAIVRGRGYRR